MKLAEIQCGMRVVNQPAGAGSIPEHPRRGCGTALSPDCPAGNCQGAGAVLLLPWEPSSSRTSAGCLFSPLSVTAGAAADTGRQIFFFSQIPTQKTSVCQECQTLVMHPGPQGLCLRFEMLQGAEPLSFPNRTVAGWGGGPAPPVLLSTNPNSHSVASANRCLSFPHL